MKHFWKPGTLLLCGLSAAVVVSGCSRNVATVPESTTANPPTAQNTETAPPPETSETRPKAATKAVPKAANIQWEKDLDTALARAKKTQKPIMIDFYATWCPPCKMLDEEIYPAPDVVKEAKNFISVKIDVDKELEIKQKYGASGLPTIVFLDASGKEIHRQVGIDGQVSSFVELMQTARARVAPTAA